MSHFIRNAWYVAATSDEINGTQPLGRTICNIQIAFYDKSGNIVHFHIS